MEKGKGYISTKIAPAIKRGVSSSKRALARVRYSDLTSGLRVIIVTGETSAIATSEFCKEILKEANFKVAVYDHSSTSLAKSGPDLAAFFKEAKKKAVDYAVVFMEIEALDDPKISGVIPEVVVIANQAGAPEDAELSARRLARLTSLLQKRPRYLAFSRDDYQYNELRQFPANEQTMSYGKHQDAEARIDRVKDYPKGTEVDIVLDHQTHLELATFLLGENNVYNLAAATTLGYMLGIKLEDIQEGIANVE